MHRARDQHPDHEPGEHADVRGHLAQPDGGVLGVEVHRGILRRAGRARSGSRRHGATRRITPTGWVRDHPDGTKVGAGVPTLRPRRAPTGRTHDAVGEPVTLGERPARTRSTDDAGRGSPRGQEPGVPGGAHPCRGDRAGAGRARGARRARGGGGLLDPGRRLHGRRRADRRRRRRRVGRRRPAAEGQGADRRGVRPAAPRPDALHLPPPRRVQGVHRRAGRLGHDGDRLRDRPDRRRRAAAAGPDVGGGRPDGAAGRGAQPGARRTAAAACCSAASPASTPRRSSSSAPASPG